MASYLSTVDIGQLQRRRRRRPQGLPIIDAVDHARGRAAAADASLALQPEMIDFLEARVRPVPVRRRRRRSSTTIDAGYALETQTRPIYAGTPDDDVTVAHELAHQWFGDSVTLDAWQDIWLNEGFATYAEWLWTEHDGARASAGAFLGNYA